MSAVLNLNSSLVNLARKHVDSHCGSKALTLLERLRVRSDLSTSLAAEVHYLLAKVHYRSGRFSNAARESRAATKLDPKNSDYQFLLGQCLEQIVGSEHQATIPFQRAVRLSPNDGAKAVAVARQLVKHGAANDGIDILHETYRTNGDNPEIVAKVVDTLIQAEQWSDAELMVAQSSASHGADEKFLDLRRQFKIRQCVEESNRISRTDPGPVLLPFRNPREKTGPKPKLLNRQTGTSGGRFVYESSDAAPIHEPAGCVLHSRMKLSMVLKRSGRSNLNSIYDHMELQNADTAEEKRLQIEQTLLSGRSLVRIVNSLPMASRKLLRTIVRVGGYVPANVLDQSSNDSSDDSPAVSLFQNGLIYKGVELSSRSKPTDTPIAMIPLDLFEKLSKVLKMPV